MQPDKSCDGLTTINNYDICGTYNIKSCVFTPECNSKCGVLDCYKGRNETLYRRAIVPKEMTDVQGKQICTYYAFDEKNLT